MTSYAAVIASKAGYASVMVPGVGRPAPDGVTPMCWIWC